MMVLHNMIVLHLSLCTLLKYPVCVCRGTAYIWLFLIQSCRLIGVGVARLEEPVFIIEKSSNLPDDKNDFPYVLFLIKELLFFIDTKCVIYLLKKQLVILVFVDRLCQLLSFSSSQQQWLQILDSFISSPLCSDSFYNISDRSDGFLQWKRGFSLFFFQSLKMCGQSFLHHRNVLLFRCINVL